MLKLVAKSRRLEHGRPRHLMLTFPDDGRARLKWLVTRPERPPPRCASQHLLMSHETGREAVPFDWEKAPSARALPL